MFRLGWQFNILDLIAEVLVVYSMNVACDMLKVACNNLGLCNHFAWAKRLLSEFYLTRDFQQSGT